MQKDERIWVRLSEEEKRKWQQSAREQRMSVSQWLRFVANAAAGLTGQGQQDNQKPGQPEQDRAA